MTPNFITFNARKATAAVGVATMLLMGTACSPTSPEPVTPISAEELAGAHKPGDVVNGIPTKSELASNSKGNYIQTTISDDDPAMKFDASLKTNPETSQLFTDEEIAEAQKFAMKFVAEEVIDSPINDDSSPENVNAWWEKHNGSIDPKHKEDLETKLKGDDDNFALVFRSEFRNSEKLAQPYSLVHKADTTRITTREITPTAITGFTQGEDKYLQFKAKGNWSSPAVLEDSTAMTENTTADLAITVTKLSDGKWAFSGYKNTYNATLNKAE